MKLRQSVLLAALLLASLPVLATNKTCEYGGTYPNCKPKPEEPAPTGNTNENNNANSQGQGQDQNQGQGQGQAQGQGQNQSATGGNSQAAGGDGGTGVGVGVGIGQGGYGGTGGTGGSATGGNATGGAGGTATGGANTLGDVGSNSAALSGSFSGVADSGNSRSNSSATGGSVGDTSSGSLSTAVVGPTSASVGDTAAVSGANSSLENTVANDSFSLSGASNGDQTSTTTSAGGSANGVVTVDAADRSSTSYHNSTRVNTFVPGDLPTNAMVIAPGASVTVAGDQACGVLATKVQIPVYQWDKKGKNKVQVGWDEDIAPYVDANGVQQEYLTKPLPNGGYYLIGSHITYAFGSYGSSNASQLGLQGGGGGGYGGLSFGSGRSYSQVGTRVIIRPCIADRVELPVIEFAKPRVPRG